MVGTGRGRTTGPRTWVGRTLYLAALLSAASLPVAAATLPQTPAQLPPANNVAEISPYPVPAPGSDPRAGRVRPTGPQAEDLLREGRQLSATFAALIEALEQSDLIVYVHAGGAPGISHLRFACATPRARFVRITINGLDAESIRIAALAHELRHAVEVAGAPEVRDDETLRAFYERCGQRMSDGQFCTREAQAAGAAVLNELCSAERPRLR
jgi:hypothetical protein